VKIILVVGDVNNAIACSLVAAKMNIKVIHGFRWNSGGNDRSQCAVPDIA
jgi:UDP-N-acetylglucosamine 2-epimerase